MRAAVVLLLLALCVIHHDMWWWGEAEPLVFGFIPIGLAWHVLISLAAGAVWWLASRFCWPADLDQLDAE